MKSGRGSSEWANLPVISTICGRNDLAASLEQRYLHMAPCPFFAARLLWAIIPSQDIDPEKIGFCMSDSMTGGSGGEITSRQFMPTDMIRDLNIIALIPADKLEQLRDTIAAKEVLAGDEALISLVESLLEEEGQAEAVLNAIRSIRPDQVQQMLELLSKWRGISDNPERDFSDEVFERLCHNLPIVVSDYPAVARIRKADGLSKVLGNELQSLHFICDVRPVFNESRDAIDMLIPLTTLKIAYERQNGQTDVIEIVLTEGQLDELTVAAAKARQKIQVLERFIEQLGD